MRVPINPSHPAEGDASLPKILKCGIRRCQQTSDHPLLMPHLVQAPWVAHLQRVQQDRIQHSEDDDVCPNTQHQRDQGYDRERGRLPKNAERITNIQQHALHKWKALFSVVAFPDHLHGSELQAGLAAGFLARHAGANVSFRQGRNMRFHLFFESFVTAVTAREVEKAREKAIQGSHAKSSAFITKKHEMIAAVSSQSRFSASSNFCPTRVSR